jgi:hypothetical protein
MAIGLISQLTFGGAALRDLGSGRGLFCGSLTRGLMRPEPARAKALFPAYKCGVPAANLDKYGFFRNSLRHVRRHFPYLFAHQLLGVISQQLFFRLDVHEDLGDFVHPLPHLVGDGVSNEMPFSDR